MGIYSKLIGGTIGWMLGGPLGAVIGAVIGHSFDKRRDGSSEETIYGRSGGGSIRGEQSQLTFFVAAFSMLGKMANADGYISPEERRAVEDFINNDLKLRPQERDFAIRIFNTAAVSGESFEKFAEQFYRCFRNEYQIIETMMDILVKLSYADGKLNPKEEQFIASAASIFNYTAYDVNRLKVKYGASSGRANYGGASSSSSSLDVAYSVLGCVSSDTPETIKSKYKKLIKEYHPDVIASKGLPEEFTEFANKKFAQIKSAYEDIRKARNF